MIQQYDPETKEPYFNCINCGLQVIGYNDIPVCEECNNTIKMEDKTEMEYQKELKRLQEGSNYWKPKVGQFKVKSLTELESADPYVQKRSDGTEESHEQSKIQIVVDDDEKTWTFGNGATPASTYGQLVELATKKNDTLKDVEFTVIVKSDGTKNDYTIVE